MLPLSLLKTAQNHPMLVELKNGETYNGHLVSCDNWMNINLREVICTSRTSHGGTGGSTVMTGHSGGICGVFGGRGRGMPGGGRGGQDKKPGRQAGKQ
ncbi:hypothetical protein GDO81_001018 [Engystomops pustulosus]|uniref:U6 snRNA-associated Sm-like protein LSm4 n=1 Tax=Engystomops pustulosus TaxID=76066 RepID=A0AAV7D9Z8_ENGPU|nr:hypothetical protein GDO81_001018 [Engystomops pustulosus]